MPFNLEWPPKRAPRRRAHTTIPRVEIMKNRQNVGRLIRWALPGMLAAFGGAAHADDVSLFDASGAAQAYISVDDGLTIYMRSGKPVAYLQKGGSGGGYNVYGFNGKHLGWFAKGAIYGPDGTASCATAHVMTSIPRIEPMFAGRFRTMNSMADSPTCVSV